MIVTSKIYMPYTYDVDGHSDSLNDDKQEKPSTKENEDKVENKIIDENKKKLITDNFVKSVRRSPVNLPNTANINWNMGKEIKR